MVKEISRAEMLKIPVRYHSDDKVKSILKKYGGILNEQNYK